MSTHYDAWEAVYRQERVIREKCQPDISPSLTEKLTEQLTESLGKNNIGGVVVVDDDVSTEPVAVGVVVGVGVEGETGSIVESSITPSEITTESFEVIDENNQSPSKIVDEKNQLNSLLSPSLNQDNSLNTIENMQKQLIKQQQVSILILLLSILILLF